MKTVFLLLLSILVLNRVSAQKLDSVKILFKENKLTEAKKGIDEILMLERYQKNPDVYYTKAKIYNAVAQHPSLFKQYPEARMDAFLALKKYTEIDDKAMLALKIDAYKPINEIYTGYYQEAANNFNTQNYTASLEGFANAIMVSSFMTEKGWISLKLDTNSVLYAGVSAEKLNRLDEAAIYYGLLVDNRVTSEGFVEIYKWVANHYYTVKNFSVVDRYLSIGKEFYPTDPFWSSLEIDIAREKGNKENLFALYEKTIAANPGNYLYRYNYAVELYQHAYNADQSKRTANSVAFIQKVEEQLKEAIKIQPSYSRAQLFAGQVKYNMGVDLLTLSKSALDEEKKRTLKANALEKFKDAIPYFRAVEQLNASQGTIKPADKEDLKEAYDLLITIYDQTGQKDKMQEYETKLNTAKKD